ncbi:MAG: YciI family protein [Gammaproteobacteria bacterium]|nr:YciI family protein [Gammaproteobacteria bacterium]
MLYMIVAVDAPGSLSQRLALRGEHRSRLQRLIEEGRLVLAGPNPAVDAIDPGEAGFTGSMIVAEFNSLADAKAWADADPYATNGVYQSVTVKPFVRVLP